MRNKPHQAVIEPGPVEDKSSCMRGSGLPLFSVVYVVHKPVHDSAPFKEMNCSVMNILFVSDSIEGKGSSDKKQSWEKVHYGTKNGNCTKRKEAQ
jgi:hypothetical protein